MPRYEWDEELSSIIERASVDRMPVVVFRADDEHAIDTLWRKRRLHTDAGQHDQAAEVDQLINEFAKWRLLHPAQPADTPPRTHAEVREQRGPVPGTLPAVLAERIKAEDGA